MHNEQIGNDRNGLFANIAGPKGYLHDADHVLVEASIGSFFEPVASAGTLDLGLFFAAWARCRMPSRSGIPARYVSVTGRIFERSMALIEARALIEQVSVRR